MLLVSLTQSEMQKAKAWIESQGYEAQAHEDRGLVIPDNWLQPILTFLGLEEVDRFEESRLKGLIIVRTMPRPEGLNSIIVFRGGGPNTRTPVGKSTQ